MAATDLVTLADAKGQLNIPTSDTSQDAELAGYISGVTRVVERHVGAVVNRSVSQVFDGGRAVLLLGTLPVSSVTSVTDSGTALSADDYEASEAGVLTRRAGTAAVPFLSGVQTVTVVYVAGRVADTATVATDFPELRLAALLILQHMWETQRPAGQGSFSQASDDYDPRYAYSVPRRAQELLGVEQGEAGGFA